MPFTFTRLDIPDVQLIIPKVFQDERGFFLETYKFSDFATTGISGVITQMNHSASCKNVVRGLHYQMEPAAQGKIVRAIVGEVFDVAVDLRKGSPWYGQWVGEKLSAVNKHMLYIPNGFAHGFSVLSERAEIVYYASAEYAPDLEYGITWNDPQIAVDWLLTEEPIISKKDAQWPTLEQCNNNYKY